MNISQLSSMDSLSVSDLLAVWSAANSDTRKASLSVLLEFVQENVQIPSAELTQYESPSANGFNIAVALSDIVGQPLYLLLTPNAAYAAGTITLPARAECVDGQTLLVTCTQAVTALTIAGNGATVAGAPTTLAANSFFKLRYDGVNMTWYRVG
jgi:hypothetical protein